MPLRDHCRLSVVVAPVPGESAMSLLLRAFQANSVDYVDGMRWLGLDRRQALTDGDVASMAWALHVDVDEVRCRLVLPEWGGGGRWVHLSRQRLSRWVAPTCMTAKVCPLCLRETGFGRIGWMTRAVPACQFHGYSFIQKCSACGKPVRWARPALRICGCSRFFKLEGESKPVEAELKPWLDWTAALLEGGSVAAVEAELALPPLLRAMSLDGAYRMIEAFGLLKVQGESVRNVRHSSATLDATANVLIRGLRRITGLGLAGEVDPRALEDVHLPVLREIVDAPATEADGHRAAWLLDIYRAARPSGQRRVGARPRRQLPLFL